MFGSKFEEKELKSEIHSARIILSDEDVQFQEINKNYILFKIIGNDFKIVAYPHKTSAGNRHVRVRDENSKNKKESLRIMKKLYDLSGNNCRYQSKR